MASELRSIEEHSEESTPTDCSIICGEIRKFRTDFNNRLGTLEREVTELHKRFDDTPPGLNLAKWSAAQAEMAVVGTAELRKVFREEIAKVKASNRLLVAVVTAISVIAVALVTAISSNWPAVREKQVTAVIDKRWGDFKAEFDSREQNICNRCEKQQRGYQ